MILAITKGSVYKSPSQVIIGRQIGSVTNQKINGLSHYTFKECQSETKGTQQQFVERFLHPDLSTL